MSVLGVAFCIYGKDQYIVDNVFHHEGTFSDRIVLYLMPVAVKPVLKQEVVRSDGSKRVVHITLDCSKSYNKDTLLMPNDLKTKLQNIQSHTHPDAYTIMKVTVDKNKILHITLGYDANVCTIEAGMCDAISLKTACIIHVYYTEAMRITESHNAILHHVAKQKPQDFTVALDCGHGGTDLGKVGCANTVEKNITLSLGNQVALLLRKKGFNVCMTRHDDSTIALDMRTKIANTNKADLFVSIHANSGPKGTKGIETYWTEKAALCGNDIPYKENDTIKNVLCSLDMTSNALANSIHTHVLHSVKKKYPLIDRSIKRAVSQVLLGADMPGALVEVGFLSDEKEARMLSNQQFQRMIAASICAAIQQYCIMSIKKDCFTNIVA